MILDHKVYFEFQVRESAVQFFKVFGVPPGNDRRKLAVNNIDMDPVVVGPEDLFRDLHPRERGFIVFAIYGRGDQHFICSNSNIYGTKFRQKNRWIIFSGLPGSLTVKLAPMAELPEEREGR